MGIKKRIAAVAAALVLAISTAGVFTPDAEAIKRVSCGDNASYLWLYSNSTTCWADLGVAEVTLYQVAMAKSGSNNGWIRTESGRDIPYTSVHSGSGGTIIHPSATIVRVAITRVDRTLLPQIDL